jgi:hypothetical protein
MIGSGAVYVAAAGVVGTVVAVTLPWARYGGIEINVADLPNWGFYVSSVVVLHLCVGWALIALTRRGRSVWLPRAVALISGVAAIVSTVVVMSRYEDADALFGSVVPLVVPHLGLGGPVAVAAILISAGAVVIPSRRFGLTSSS